MWNTYNLIKVLVIFTAACLTPDQTLLNGCRDGPYTLWVVLFHYPALFALTISVATRFCSSFLTFLTISQECVAANVHFLVTRSALARSERRVFAEAGKATNLASPSNLKQVTVFATLFEPSPRIVVKPSILHSLNSLANFRFHFAWSKTTFARSFQSIRWRCCPWISETLWSIECMRLAALLVFIHEVSPVPELTFLFFYWTSNSRTKFASDPVDHATNWSLRKKLTSYCSEVH